ncbi:stalk domain-containing protein [Cohnella sp. GCM10020058]|uniref:stalk domain-containing protein n=1 Tax=Cohnella sp. GCM10020058 TaxID=3317330 RepID=UPI00363C6E4D
MSESKFNILRAARVVCIPMLAGTLVVASFAGTGPTPFAQLQLGVASAATAAVTYKLVKSTEAIVTSGVKQINYSWVPSDTKKSTVLVHVMQIDLTNPYVQMNAMSGKGGSVTTGQSVGAMTKATGAVAGVNGDVFQTGTTSEGAPLGAELVSGQLIVAPTQLQGMYAFALTKDKTPIIDQFAFSGSVQADNGAQFKLSGLNNSSYTTYPDKTASHVNALYIYTSAWTAANRPSNSGTTPMEALVVDGTVTEIGDGVQILTPIPANGYILRGHKGKDSGNFILNNLPVGTKVTSAYNLVSQTSGKTYSESDFQMIVSGHTLLMDGGKASAFSRDVSGVSGSSNTARTAVGYAKDGMTAYLVTVEKYGTSNGATLADFQKILTSLGVWKAVNLDGGGSTTMITRPLGETATTLAHSTTYGTTQRAVADGIGVFTTAPAGETKGITVSGSKTLFIGQQATYSLKAYDTYYNPVDPGGLTASWSVSGGLGSFASGVLTASKAGTGELTVKSGAASDKASIEVIGGSQINQLKASPNTTVLQQGAKITVKLTATLADGRTLEVPADSVKWEFKGFTAAASGGVITIGAVGEQTKTGYAIARYDGFSTAFALSAGAEKSFETFENATYPVTFDKLPAETAGTAAIVTGLPGRETSKVLQLTYDFTVGTGNRFAYALPNGSTGLAISGSPSALTLDVYGDGSNNWLRAEFKGADGKLALVDIAKMANWTGWKQIRVDLSGSGITYPATLTKLYVVNLAEGQDERALTGAVAFDNLSLQYPSVVEDGAQSNIVLQLGQKSATVDGKSVALDIAPLLLNGTTYLPLRFVSDALGADIGWDQAAQKATVTGGGKLVELWVGKPDLLNTGVRATAAATPILRSGRVLVPVRVVSTELGRKVGWDQKTKTITIR